MPIITDYALRISRSAIPRLLVCLAFVSQPAAAQTTTTEIARLDANTHFNADFGGSVAIAGDLAVIGARLEGTVRTNGGAAYISTWNGSNWGSLSLLYDGAPSTNNDNYGAAVATDGAWVFIGAPHSGASGQYAGAVFVYQDDGTHQNFPLVGLALTGDGSSATDGFGSALSISGNTLAIGAPGEQAVYIFTLAGSAWTEATKISGTGVTFGSSVALDGSTLLIGAPQNPAGDYVDVYTGAGNAWTRIATLSPPTGAGEAFGRSIGFDGTHAIISAHLDDHGGGTLDNRGTAYIYDASSWSTPPIALTADTESQVGDNFGISVSIGNGTAVVGAPRQGTATLDGVAYVFRLGGSGWVRSHILDASDSVPGDFFGWAVAGSDTVLVGAPANPQQAGYIYTLTTAPPIDSDGDGLSDVIEDDIGTDPLNADTDGDNISDGDEVNFTGTNPLSADTDGDGVNDDVDPLPLVPGVTGEWLEAESRSLADAIAAIDLSKFNAPNGKANKGRRNSLASRVRNAAKAIARDDYASAIDLLEGVLDKVDGDDSVPDWMNPGPEQEALATEITLLIGLLLYG